MEITKLSTKGQIVIPDTLRKDIEVGTPFVVVKQNDLIVLKEVSGLTKQEIAEMQELDKIWKEIDAGKGITLNQEEFFSKMKEW